ncbi:MAG: PilZ domain-containing protein [Myxococcaceae bacterium]|nr:MAG: PilZ domain-containing protein [Myxococcaceae bacterium]
MAFVGAAGVRDLDAPDPGRDRGGLPRRPALGSAAGGGDRRRHGHARGLPGPPPRLGRLGAGDRRGGREPPFELRARHREAAGGVGARGRLDGRQAEPGGGAVGEPLGLVAAARRDRDRRRPWPLRHPRTRATHGLALKETRAMETMCLDLDRRNNERTDVELWVDAEGDSGSAAHRALDLSLGGLRLDRGVPHPTGTRLMLELRLPDREAALRIEAEVTGAHRDRGCGMRFIGLSRAQRVRLADYLLRCWA